MVGKKAKWLGLLAEFVGIAPYYIDKMRVRHDTSDNVYRRFLLSMGYDVANENLCRIEYEKELCELYSTGLGYSYSVFVGETVSIKFWLPKDIYSDDGYISFDLIRENDGYCVNSESIIRKVSLDKCDVCCVNGVKFLEYNFRLWNTKNWFPDYYLIRAKYRDKVFETFLIVAPKRAYLSPKIKSGKKILGVGFQLYGLRSDKDFGIGDFGDLNRILPTIAKSGCDLVGINPLGPMYAGGDRDVSPYRTLSREFVNYLYIDLRAVPEFKKSDAVQNLMKKPVFLSKIKKVHKAEFIDYLDVFGLKLSVLKLMYKFFYKNEITKKSERARYFEQFKKIEGDNLFNLCLYEALLENREPNPKEWGGGFCDINSKEMKKWIAGHKLKIDFYAYVHWIAGEQLASLQVKAKRLGMDMGLYLDIPVGAASDGVEVWQNNRLFADGMDIGTPPDTIRPKGQTWGLCPPIPLYMRKSRYVAFRDMLRRTMRYAGAVRLDHSFSLKRLFWVAGGDGANVGAYVNYNFKDLVAILCLESLKNNCLVIGEDLGNAPIGFSSVMQKRAIFGNRVLYRQLPKNNDVNFAKLFPYYSLCQVGTHDQATSCGFWIAEDIERNKDCGLYPKQEHYLYNVKKRNMERFDFFRLFGKIGAFWNDNKYDLKKCLNGSSVPKGLEYSFNICGAKTDSAIYFVRADDVYAGVVMQNVPGTVDEYPNWRVKFPETVDNIVKDGKFVKFFSVLKKYRK